MHFVYLLKTASGHKQFYIGQTQNLERRMQEHLQNKVYTTKRLKEPELIYYEAYSDSELAKKREHQLKRFSSAYIALLKRLRLK